MRVIVIIIIIHTVLLYLVLAIISITSDFLLLKYVRVIIIIIITRDFLLLTCIIIIITPVRISSTYDIKALQLILLHVIQEIYNIIIIRHSHIQSIVIIIKQQQQH